MDRYTHLGVVDQTAPLEELSNLPIQTHLTAEAMKATGTDGASPARLPFACRDNEATSGNMRTRGSRRESETNDVSSPQTLAAIGHDAPCGSKMMPDEDTGPRGGMVDTGDLKSPGE